MTFSSHDLVSVYYQGLSSKELVGSLLLKNRQIFFEYDPTFLKRGLELSPFKLPLKAGVITCPPYPFEGLFGVFNDSIPDGWGRLLLDRKLMSLGLNPSTLSPLDRLCFIGNQGMGALSYEPANPLPSLPLTSDFDEIDKEIQSTLEKEEDQYIDDLLALGGSSAGARPKILIRLQDEDWMIKFRSSLDPQDMGALEYAYHLMAREAGLNVPEAKLFPSKKGVGFFGVKRFDRKNHQGIHMHTIAGLLHADHRKPSLDYGTLMKATLYLTQDIRECEVQFRNAIFNVLSHNRDDHSKNFSFLMDTQGTWKVSPAYDLTFSSGPGGEHATMILGEGKNPKYDHLIRLSEIGALKKEKTLEIMDQVSSAIHQWKTFAEEAGVSKRQTQNIGHTLDQMLKSTAQP